MFELAVYLTWVCGAFWIFIVGCLFIAAFDTERRLLASSFIKDFTLYTLTFFSVPSLTWFAAFALSDLPNNKLLAYSVGWFVCGCLVTVLCFSVRYWRNKR